MFSLAFIWRHFIPAAFKDKLLPEVHLTISHYLYFVLNQFRLVWPFRCCTSPTKSAACLFKASPSLLTTCLPSSSHPFLFLSITYTVNSISGHMPSSIFLSRTIFMSHTHMLQPIIQVNSGYAASLIVIIISPCVRLNSTVEGEVKSSIDIYGHIHSCSQTDGSIRSILTQKKWRRAHSDIHSLNRHKRQAAVVFSVHKGNSECQAQGSSSLLFID